MMRRIGLLAILVGLLVVPTASAKISFWWWSVTKANRMVVWHDGHNSGPRGDYTTMLKADCLGTGTFRRRTARGAKLYHVFRCDVWFRDDDTGRLWTPAYQRSIGMSRRPVHFCSSKTSPYGMLPYGLGVPGCP